MATTVKSGLFVPEIATEIASAEFPNRLALGFAGSPFVQVIPVDALGNEGDQVKFPRWNALGAFEDMVEDTALTPEAMSSTTDIATVLAGGKGVEITDFASLAAKGDPSVEVGRQYAELAARYVDSKLIAKAGTTGLTQTTGATFTVDSFTTALIAAWGDKAFGDIGGLVVHSKVLGDILKLADFKSASASGMASTAVAGVQAVGTIMGYPLYTSDRLTVTAGSPNTYTNLVLKRGALGIMFQRQLLIEADRNILKKNTVIAADVRFAVHQFYGNPARVLKLVTQ